MFLQISKPQCLVNAINSFTHTSQRESDFHSSEPEEMPEISIAMRVDDPMLQIVSEVSKDLSEWTWVMRRNTEIDQWEINEDLVEFVGWESLGDGMQEARLRYLGDREKIFTRMAVNYKSGE